MAETRCIIKKDSKFKVKTSKILVEIILNCLSEGVYCESEGFLSQGPDHLLGKRVDSQVQLLVG